MKQFGNIFVNELIKLWRRTTVKVLLIIALVIAALSPLTDIDFISNGDFEFNEVFTEWTVREYASVAEARDRAVKLGIRSGEWRMKLVSVIVENCRMIETYENNQAYQDKDTLNQIKNAREENEELWKLIEENDFKKYIAQLQTVCEPRIAAIRDESVGVKELFNDTEKKYSERVKSLANKISQDLDAAAGLAEKAFAEALSGKMEGTAADTRLVDAVSGLVLYGRSGAVNRYGFRVNSVRSAFDRAELVSGESDADTEYLEAAAEDAAALLESIAVAEYAIANGKDEMTTANASRGSLLSLVTGAFYGMLILFGIYAAVTSVAAEFSRKTVNMLVIRPVSRRSIVAAKFLACLALVYAAALAGLLIGMLTSSLKYGFGDLFQPYIYWNGTAAAELPFIPWFLWRALIASLNIVFFISLAFCLAMLIRHTTGSIILSFVLYAFSSAIVLIRHWFFTSLTVEGAANIYPYLPLSYIDFRTNVFADVTMLINRGSIQNITGYIIGMFSDLRGLGLLYGSAMLIAMSALLYFISSRSFRKRDIKS